MSKHIPLLTILGLAAAVLPAPGHTQNQPPLTLKSDSIDLPAGDRMFPTGPGAEAITNNCLACHSAGMVLNQPALSKATWDAEVKKMITVYKASVAAEDIPAILDYLDAVKGAHAPPR